MKQYKDETFLEYTIKIRKVREVRGDKLHKECKDRKYLVNVEMISGWGIGFSSKQVELLLLVPKKVFKIIQEQIL